MTEEERKSNQESREPDVDAATQSDPGDSAEPDLTDELFAELTILGGRFVEVVQSAWNSDERKRIEADLKMGLTSVAQSLEDGFKTIRENEQAKEVIDKADSVAESVGEKVRSSEAVNELGSSLVRGLQSLAKVLERWTDEMTADVDETASKTSSPGPERGQPGDDDGQGQDIPIDRE